jgi:tetratricopeptide (TPR) repeat protein
MHTRPVETLAYPDIEETVKSKEGRAAYHQFLLNNPRATPVQKLFGLGAPLDITSDMFEKQAKRIIVHIHPDKVEADEEPYCSELFILVNRIREFKDDPYTYRLIQIDDIELPNPLYTGDLDVVLNCMYQGNWHRAKQYLLSTEESDQKGELGAIIFLRLGEFDEAINIFGESSPEIKKVLIDTKEMVEGARASKQDLLQLIQRAQEIYPESSENEAWKLAAPHHMYVRLKDCIPEKGAEYEKCLRNAIRRCPDCLSLEKSELIKELIEFLRSKDVAFSPGQLRLNVKTELKQSIYSSFLTTFKNIDLGLGDEPLRISPEQLIVKINSVLDPSFTSKFAATFTSTPTLVNLSH